MQKQKMLAGHVALVTGGARRLGRASALTLAQSGADLVITFLNSAKDAEKTAGDIEGLGVRAMAIKCDVTRPADVQKSVQDVIKEFGRLDVLVNNAGSYETAKLDEISIEQWDTIFAVNVRGPFLLAKAAVPHLRRSRGRIINLGSLGGLRAWADHAHYSASKAALHMLTKAMAKALAPEISVNCVAPGMIDLGEKSAREFMARMAKQTPMRRNGSGDDVSAAILFFATAPKFITGQIMAVDGGLSL
jgi:3-oxoacyl-[acyl-carrier protein] reductase/pteridine reductase